MALNIPAVSGAVLDVALDMMKNWADPILILRIFWGRPYLIQTYF